MKSLSILCPDHLEAMKGCSGGFVKYKTNSEIKVTSAVDGREKKIDLGASVSVSQLRGPFL